MSEYVHKKQSCSLTSASSDHLRNFLFDFLLVSRNQEYRVVVGFTKFSEHYLAVDQLTEKPLSEEKRRPCLISGESNNTFGRVTLCYIIRPMTQNTS